MKLGLVVRWFVGGIWEVLGWLAWLKLESNGLWWKLEVVSGIWGLQIAVLVGFWAVLVAVAEWFMRLIKGGGLACDLAGFKAVNWRLLVDLGLINVGSVRRLGLRFWAVAVAAGIGGCRRWGGDLGWVVVAGLDLGLAGSDVVRSCCLLDAVLLLACCLAELLVLFEVVAVTVKRSKERG